MKDNLKLTEIESNLYKTLFTLDIKLRESDLPKPLANKGAMGANKQRRRSKRISTKRTAE